MYKLLYVPSLCVSLVGLFASTLAYADSTDIHAVTNCSGTQVVRTASGNFEVRYVEPNLAGCVGGKILNFSGSSVSTSSGMSQDVDESIVMEEVTNCSGLRITSLSNGKYFSTQVAPNLAGCVEAKFNPRLNPESPRVNIDRGPLLDLTSADIVRYRTERIKEQGIRFAHVIRSARIRREANMQSRTAAYLMNNDAVVITGKETGWVKVQGATLSVTDPQENIVKGNTQGKAKGYTASKFLRDPNASDLVRIEQADQAYWSDIARVKVAHLVNVRSHPWHTAKIVTTLSNNTPLYVVSTVDNWSEVRNDSGSIRGYIRSDFLKIDKIQRVDHRENN